ncbi:Zinc metallopeptidase [Penicillium macrosclerotiorum]|uniref:Zinc metallopeptidase n=1 Tax=Penicillium macrosclerotiorum TaxID=303699 RepID=UPI00254794A5|nr:Zinc metallopeptidase [Penicillium macrosclerotiorum]KAJ5688774.1 Zinc metallopeptidase [Penicillium macrosclerotiorum]
MTLHQDEPPVRLNASWQALLERFRPDLAPFEVIYRNLHCSPELSGEEAQTARTAAAHLSTIPGVEVHTQIGGHGVAAVLANGPGPTLLLRADMDALPVTEKTNLPYASAVPDVMHACGHDFHVAALLAAISTLHAARGHWAGTLVAVFQPAEEHLDGAQAMLDDGLYERVPRPDLVLAQHVTRMRTGTVGLRAGALLTAADSFDVRVFGRGGHGSAPQTTVDPVVIGAAIVTRLQSVVAREVAPGEVAVVTCGSIHAGTAANIIPDFLDLQLSLRTDKPAVRTRVVAAVRRIIEAECRAGGATEVPTITRTSSSPPTVNDGATVGRLWGTFEEYFGDRLVEMERPSASEDFSLLATAVGAPYAMWMFGGVDEKSWDEAVENGTVDELPNNHSPFFAPVIEPTLRTGVDAMVLGALTFLGKQN